MAKRFRGGNFDYTWNQGAFWQRFPRRPAVIGVCFTGDLFGKWVPEKAILLVQSRVLLAPQHQFVFLTKNPARYAQFNPWPDNAWLGTTITGAETEPSQADRLNALRRARGGHKWLSYEPALGTIKAGEPLEGIEWVVVGGLSGRKPDPAIVARSFRMSDYADAHNVPVWEKLNLGVDAKTRELPPALREPWQNWQRKEQP